jgi:predicted nuclease with TOPRIM domain
MLQLQLGYLSTQCTLLIKNFIAKERETMDMEHERRLTEVEERSKSNTHRIDKVEKQQGEFVELVSSVKVLAEREQNVENDVKEIKSDVKSLASKPGKRWDSLVDKIIVTVAAAVVGFILAKIGM